MSQCTTAPLTLDVSPNSVVPPALVVESGQSHNNGLITYGLVVRMALSRPGFGFRIEHDLPEGVDFVEARPRATVVGEHLIWQLGRVDPGQEVRLEVVIRPQEGTVLRPDDIATFTGTYSHNLYFQAPVVRPRLTARISGPASVQQGSAVEFVLDVANIGSWQAENVRAKVHLPREFEHPAGPVLEFEIGALEAGQFRRMVVPTYASARGNGVIHATLTGPGDRQTTVEFTAAVV